jgi:hypothetical protein
MSKSLISTGINPNDGNGDTLLAGAGKVNSNFNEIYSTLGNGTDLSIGVGKTIISTNAQGNVGIKTTNPTSELYVSGNQYVTGILTATSLFGNIVGSSGTITNLTGTAGTITTLNSTNGTITTLTGTNLNYTGISSVGSLSIGSTEVISSARQLKNITSLDATTKATIESSIQLEPNNFSDLQVTGVSTFTNGPVLIGTGTSTGTVNQDLQIIGGAYISDNVGIGTTNPGTALEIINASDPQLRISNGTTSGYGLIQLGRSATAAQNWHFGSEGNNYLNFWNGNSGAGTGPLLSLYSPGNTTNHAVLIGGSGVAPSLTGTASQRLQVTGGAYVSGNFGVGHTNPTSALDVIGNGEFTGSVVGAALSVSGISTFRNGPVLIGAATSTGTSAQRLQVTGGGYVSGNLGVGHTNPTSALDIIGDANITGVATITSNLVVNGNTLFVNATTNNIGIGTINPTASINIKAGTATANTAPLKFTRGTNLSGIETGAVEYDGRTLNFTPDTSFGRASIPTTVYTSGAGTNLTTGAEATIQVLFPSANDTITLQVGTYYVTMDISATRGTTSTTSAALRIRFGGAGTAVGTFSGHAIGSGADAGTSSAHRLNGVALNGDNVIGNTSTTPSSVYISHITGILRITTAGTFIPSYSLSANLLSAGTSTVPAALNYMLIQSLDTTGSAAAIGGWA